MGFFLIASSALDKSYARMKPVFAMAASLGCGSSAFGGTTGTDHFNRLGSKTGYDGDYLL